MAKETEELKYEKTEDFRTQYANSVRLTVSLWDFRFHFGQTEEGFRIAESNRVIMSPQHAKMFLKVFERNIHLYEQKFGEINLPTDVIAEEPTPN
jgi:hypothetical protein